MTDPNNAMGEAEVERWRAASKLQQEINGMGFGPVQVSQGDVQRLASRVLTAERERDELRDENDRLRVALEDIVLVGEHQWSVDRAVRALGQATSC